jgi:anti-anti-sigma factor
MKRQLTTSGIGNKTRKEVKLADRARIARRAHGSQPAHPPAAASGRPALSLAPESVWTHTLVLAGELDLRSARTLEAEIERLCEEGVTRIVLDLRELARIDAIGVAVIAFRAGHCTRHGYEFALIAGAPSVQLAFETAGVLDSLPFIAATIPGAEDPGLAGGELEGSGPESTGEPGHTEEARAHGGAGIARGGATAVFEPSI